MTKFRLIAAAVMAFCALMLVGGAGTAAAQGTATSLTDPIAMTGTAKNGKKFTGTYRVKRFVAEGGKVLAVGTLKGKLKGRNVRRTGVKIPVNGTTFGGIGAAGLAHTSQVQLCQVLDLTLGPLDLSLLGLIVHLDPVHLDIDADPAGGLLGQLLCGLAGGVPPTPGPGVAQIVAVLNAILALLQGLLP
jgi:hypothetical protein